MEDRQEELRLLKESLWYIQWSVMFGVANIIVAVVGLIEVYKGRDGAVFALIVLYGLILLLIRYLYTKSRQYRQKADEASK